MAFRTKSRKAERGEVELLRGLIKLANQLQSSLELDAIVHVIATALSETFGFREATVYLREDDGAYAAHATVGEYPEELAPGVHHRGRARAPRRPGHPDAKYLSRCYKTRCGGRISQGFRP